MKELTIEEKAKRFDTMFIDAEDMYHDGLACSRPVKEVLSTLFPELKESDDERIRKEIVRFIQMEVEDEIVGNKWIAWLEKQNSNVDNANKEYWRGQEWSNEDESYLKSALWHISYAISNGKETSVQCDLTKWLKSLKNRVIPQPKKEWSEEDKKMLENIKKTLYNLTIVEADGQAAFKKELAWLKSLKERYTWKPSKEQMRFLLKYAEQNNYDGRILTLLYNDLKKLK